jgi:hypothetical protein
MWRAFLLQLWRDDTGSVIAAEYMMLAGIVVLGGATGLAAMRDATVTEGQETAKSIRAMNQSYRVPTTKTDGASTNGAQVIDSGTVAGVNASRPITISP